MKVSDLLTFVRKQTQASSSNVTDDDILSYLNIAYHKIENMIVDMVDEDYFRDYMTADTVAGQNEYPLETSTSTKDGVKKINRVEVKQKDGESYKLLKAGTLNDYNQAEGEITDMFYEFRDGSIFIYPKPTEAITGGVKVYTVLNLKDLSLLDEEDAIYPRHTELRQFHYIIGLGAIPFVERQRDIKDKGNYTTSMQIFNAEVQDMIVQLNSKHNEPIEGTLPNSNMFA